MAKRNSRHRPKKNKSKKSRANNNETSFFHEQESMPKSSFDEIAEIFLGSNAEKEAVGGSTNSKKSSTADSKKQTNTAENSSQDSTKANEGTAQTNSTKTDECYEEMKVKQQELLNKLKNLSDAVAAMTLTRDNIASLNIEILSNIYFTREVRPLIDAVNLIAFASSNMTIIAQNLNINTMGDKKEIKDAFKLSYKLNAEIADIVPVLTRRVKLYTAYLNNMDRNCPPFTFEEDS